MEKVTVFDTTLSDGEQSPGACMTPGEKLRMAEELDALGVDVIEAGSPGLTSQDFDAVRRIAGQLRRPVIAARAGATREDIDRAAEALEGAERARIHTFLATSDAWLRALDVSRDACLARVHEAVSRARGHTPDVEFSAEDATRADLAFLCRVMETAIEAGATTVNVCDTLGYAVPGDLERIVKSLRSSVRGIDGVTVSVRCKDDLGLAVANTLAAVQLGARQVECTVNGIGERAGNASLEEVVMALRVRPDLGAYQTAVRSERLWPASQLLAQITGIRPQPNKAIVGENAFAHEADPRRATPESPIAHEILTPETVGARRGRLVLGRHSGRSALEGRLRELGYELEPAQMERAYRMFRMLAETKKAVLDEDLLAIYYEGTLDDAPRLFKLEHLHVVCGRRPARATVRVREGNEAPQEAAAEGAGPIDATFAALQEVIPWEARLKDFAIHASSPGKDAVGEVHLHLRVNGYVFTGRGASTDIVEAAARAFLNAVDKAAHTRQLEARALERVEYWGV